MGEDFHHIDNAIALQKVPIAPTVPCRLSGHGKTQRHHGSPAGQAISRLQRVEPTVVVQIVAMHLIAHAMQPEVTGLQLPVDTVERRLTGRYELSESLQAMAGDFLGGEGIHVRYLTKGLPAVRRQPESVKRQRSSV